MEILFVPRAPLTVQAGTNAQLSKGAGGPFAATTLQGGWGLRSCVLGGL
ncbi:MAG: hypothetical protein H0T55_06755 [Rubrobacteraceae bacterium]|nr:hypothetical protein [Rubrobacteraceae bacterium]MBA3616966.1 hypothetical protein [Rubrobacteraceae bacterium]